MQPEDDEGFVTAVPDAVGSGTGAVECRTPLGCVRYFRLRADGMLGAAIRSGPLSRFREGTGIDSSAPPIAPP